MAAPSMVSRSGDNLVVRSVVSGDALFGTEDKEETEEFNYFKRQGSDAEEEEEEEEDDNGELPQCKIKRNYSCSQCDYYTQNPRFYLYHQKQVHNEKIKIYECYHCLYASKHSQKLQRHIHMVHVMGAGRRKPKTKPSKFPKVKTKRPSSTTAPPVPSNPDMYVVEQYENEPEPVFAADGSQIYKCSVCGMTSKSQGLVARHERVVHLKKKFYRCAKCNYVTHMKARYTKHVKYHSMPMIKCELCDFKTPYKWNLDRHNKNHMGDGPFRCSVCNFTAEIKQSLTVHEMNHHVPPVGLNVVMNSSRRRLKVGASDTMGMVTEEDQIEQSELELLRMEREGTFEQLQNPADFVQAQLEIPSECNNSSGSETSMAVNQIDEPQKPSLIQIKKYKCRVCDFDGNLGELQRHEAQVHQLTTLFEKKKPSRPIPNLIPIQSGQPLLKPLAQDKQQNDISKENINNSALKDFAYIIGDDFKSDVHYDGSQSPPLQDAESKKTPDLFKKKNASFFDKLKEKLMTSATESNMTCSYCGHEAKCLSEHMKHQKTHMISDVEENSNGSSSQGGLTASESVMAFKCPNCRHSCKSSSDLMYHLQNCSSDPMNFTQTKAVSEESHSQDQGIPREDERSHLTQHPMENKVFVWNTIDDNVMTNDHSTHFPSSDLPTHSRSEEKVFVGIEVKPGYGTTTSGTEEEHSYIPKDVNTKKVFKCPHCSFWASTASRFHVHIVGHLNKRPFQCSLCHYSSNWRWDITKHIRLKTIRDPSHEKAKVLLTDETGRRNYSKYNKYLTNMKMENQSPNKTPRKILPKEMRSSAANATIVHKSPDSVTEEDIPRKSQAENKKTMWKCKKCYFRDNNREVVLEHVRGHYRSSGELNRKKKKMEPKIRVPSGGVQNSAQATAGEEEMSFVNNNNNSIFGKHEFLCETCPFVCDTWKKLEIHAEKHFVSGGKGKQFKCQFCPYFAQNEEELMDHLDIHGENEANEDGKDIVHSCTLCPYVATNTKQLVYHKNCHNQELSDHKCYRCSYTAPNNTILALHVRLHGRFSPDNQEQQTLKHSDVKYPADISGMDTSAYIDIPMVWVSKPMGISKMFKCRLCPSTNMRKINIQDHEKLHLPSAPSQLYKCSECNFISNNANSLSLHSKVHNAMSGLVLGIVDGRRTDQIQISEMNEKLVNYQIKTKYHLSADSSSMDYNSSSATELEDQEKQPQGNEMDDRVLHFCPSCPARFLYLKEMSIHLRFHELKLPFKCDSCTYTARQKQHLVAHSKVHTDEYQERTNVLTELYETAEENPRPRIAIVLGGKEPSDSVWVVVKPETEARLPLDHEEIKNINETSYHKQFSCTKCPAEFVKAVALSYHLTLHGGPGPHKCKFCDYAVKTYGNLIRHESVHRGGGHMKRRNDQVAPLDPTALVNKKNETASGKNSIKPSAQTPPDPEFGVLIHGNPQFIYPTYLKNGKMKEKRYKCHKCPSAFEKREQYKIHLSLHGSKQRYNCDKCDYSVKYYANYTQHVKKHDGCDMSQFEKKADSISESPQDNSDPKEEETHVRTTVERCNKSTNKTSNAEEQTILIKQQRSLSSNSLALEKESLNRCPHCPYSNYRKDGVTSHIKCHSSNKGNFTCKYCDYNVSQIHFLKEHVKIHFSPTKHLKADAYMKVDQMEIWAEPLDSSSDKFLVFKDLGDTYQNGERFLPQINRKPDWDYMKGRIYINLKTGEEEIEMDEEKKENIEETEMEIDVYSRESPSGARDDANEDNVCPVKMEVQEEPVTLYDRDRESHTKEHTDNESEEVSQDSTNLSNASI